MSDLNYTLLQTALEIGGRVKRIVDLETGEIARESAVGSLSGETARAGFPLSKSHIRRKVENSRGKTAKLPSVTWRVGASFLKVSQGSTGEQIGGGKKSQIRGYSPNSRRGLMYTIAGVSRTAALPCFVTLTYHNIDGNFPSPKQSKRDLKIFLQRLVYAFPDVSGIWKLEPQKSGSPHYHLLVWGVDVEELKKFVPYAWQDIAGKDDQLHLLFHLGVLHDSRHCVSLVHSFRGVWSYASKYLGKTFEVAGWDEKWTGRFWGFVQKDKIPFGVECNMEVTSSRAFHIMRYQRRFSKRRVSNKGFTLFCDASQWVKNIFQEVAQTNK